MPSSDVTTQKLIYANVSVPAFPALNVTREDFSLGFCERVFKAAKMKCEVCLQPILKATDIDAIYGKSTSLVRGRIKVVENPAPKRWLLVQGLSEESRKIQKN